MLVLPFAVPSELIQQASLEGPEEAKDAPPCELYLAQLP